MPTKYIFPLIVAFLAVAGGSFYGGMQYAKTSGGARGMRLQGGPGGNVIQFQGGNFKAGAGGQGQLRLMGGGALGEVISKDEKSLTLKLMDGGSKIVFFSASTTVGKMTDGTLEDVTAGTNVSVMGTPNQDGSITATQVQIRPNLPERMPTP
ncbi:hypothetical protein M0Q28_02970 [Patescibacteria group bacterium]|jgi:ribosomal protein L2|nr:hypothetical protein [Patescibacteria group bacterium]